MALNITLTAINSIIAIATLPIITNLAINYFDQSDNVTMPLAEVVKVFALILIPVGIGMLVRVQEPRVRPTDGQAGAHRLGGHPGVLVLGILAGESENVGEYLADVGLAAILFCIISLVVGFVVPRAFGIVENQAIASSFEIGVHNATLAIFVAENVLNERRDRGPGRGLRAADVPLAALWGTFVIERITTASESVAA